MSDLTSKEIRYPLGIINALRTLGACEYVKWDAIRDALIDAADEIEGLKMRLNQRPAHEPPAALDEFVCMHGHTITPAGLLKIRKLQRSEPPPVSDNPNEGPIVHGYVQVIDGVLPPFHNHWSCVQCGRRAEYVKENGCPQSCGRVAALTKSAAPKVSCRADSDGICDWIACPRASGERVCPRAAAEKSDREQYNDACVEWANTRAAQLEGGDAIAMSAPQVGCETTEGLLIVHDQDDYCSVCKPGETNECRQCGPREIAEGKCDCTREKYQR